MGKLLSDSVEGLESAIQSAINNYANSLLKDWFNKLVPIVVKDE